MELGATGKYPQGKLCEDDEGELQFAIAADARQQLTHIHFGKPVKWLSFGLKEARDLIGVLGKKIKELEDFTQ